MKSAMLHAVTAIMMALTITLGASAALDETAIGEAAGADAAKGADGTVRITWSRDDVPVKVDGVPLPPFAGLTSWAAFIPSDGEAMVMGDMVVFEDEVDAAMDAAFAHRLEVTALHNHFFFDVPKVYFMHVGGMGGANALARGIGAVWQACKDVRAASHMPAGGFAGEAPVPGQVPQTELEAILGPANATKDGMVKFVWQRNGTMHGTPIGGSMGLTTWATFVGNEQSAVVDGDFIMTAPEVQPVLHALRREGIHIVALHNHMIGELPAFFFTHFWGKGEPTTLARGLQAALEAQKAATSSSHD